MTAIPASTLQKLPAVDEQQVDALLRRELAGLQRKIVVLDDDPTGIQTVHGVSVYTTWDLDAIKAGFAEENRLFFVLTNSRSFPAEQTRRVHADIAQHIALAARDSGKDFLLISRGDSTLRGHYPLETQTLCSELERQLGRRYDGEVLLPFFQQGGRFTYQNIHYVQEGDRLIPAGETEFARDKTFGYHASHLGAWCEEKSGGRYRAEEALYISIDSLRALDLAHIEQKLMGVRHFGKVIVNAVAEVDVKLFCVALLRCIARGKEFLFRTAASFPKIVGGIADRPYVTHRELVADGNRNGGIVLVGSHVHKTTRQLEALRHCRPPVAFVEFNQHTVLQTNGLEREVQRVLQQAEAHIRAGRTVAVYTRRDRLDVDTPDKERQLQIAVQISDAVSGIIARLSVRPAFIVAKGGITSSDVGVKALGVKRATVLGQIRPGVPVWRTGAESKFPGMAYVIFPGNVGETQTLRETVEILRGQE